MENEPEEKKPKPRQANISIPADVFAVIEAEAEEMYLQPGQVARMYFMAEFNRRHGKGAT